MKTSPTLSLGLCLLFGSLSTLNAQEAAPAMPGPPKVLVVTREFLKPGRSGAAHQKTESAFVNAMTAAKWPVHYFAMNSLSGAPRTLFFIGYESFAAWEKDNLATAGNPTLAAAMDHASAADGDLLSSYDSSTFILREDLSLRQAVDIAHMRYFEISRFVVRPGHMKEFEELGKLYVGGYEKTIPDAHWATFESLYGTDNGGVFVVINPIKSMAEIDQSLPQSKQFMDAMGEDGMKKLETLSASCIESVQTNLFAFTPDMSYPAEEWIKADPTFWKPKPRIQTKTPATP
ncbi:MAG: hypothetical protein JWQ42_2874 [Edaphobacter sp.]|nr:hypothetical protein [Edaphobacter sp.]